MNHKIGNYQKMAFTLRQAAETTGLSVPYLRVLERRGELPAARIGTKILILAEDLEVFLRSRRNTESADG